MAQTVRSPLPLALPYFESRPLSLNLILRIAPAVTSRSEICKAPYSAHCYLGNTGNAEMQVQILRSMLLQLELGVTHMRTILSLTVGFLFAIAVVGFGARDSSFFEIDSFNVGSVLGMAGSAFDLTPKSPTCPTCIFW